jgi:hypothetical protein
MGLQMCQLLAALCVTSSLSLVTPGGSDLTGGFCLQPLALADPSAIMGPILDMVVVSCDVEGASCEGSGGA